MAKQLRTVNLEQGMPDRVEACKRLDQAILQAKKDNIPALKIIHGYGSTGVGGILRPVLRNHLRKRKDKGEIRAFISGESWSQFETYSKELLRRVPESLLDPDLGRNNRGITLVLL